MYQKRSIENFCFSDEWLNNKLLFLSGPRQVGKTTVVQNQLSVNEAYFNWDDPKVRKLYFKDSGFFENVQSKWICFDEIHKRPKWKDILKGVYDVYKNDFHFMITGSAKLDFFRHSGDSLVGRYFHTHLFPLNVADFEKTDHGLFDKAETLIDKIMDSKESKVMEDLIVYSGFPEPFFKSSEGYWKRWSKIHLDLLIREDLRDLTKVQEIDKIENLVSLLRPRIGSTVSNNSLAGDLETTHKSIKRWLLELEKVHSVFPVKPYSKKISRAILRECKYYFVDWKESQDKVFENYVAATLYRAVTLWHDRFGENFELNFVRTHDGTEVDFLITKDKRPWLLVEAKEGKPEISSACHRFSHELDVPCVVVTRQKGYCKKVTHDKEKKQKIYQISMNRFATVLA